MSGNRATKSGLAAEAQGKMLAKWSPDNAKEAIKWVGNRIGEELALSSDDTMEECHQLLKDGLILCKLANWVIPGSVGASKLKPQKLPFKQMELIGLFLATMQKAGIHDNNLFQTVDLYEKVNMVQVILTIDALGRLMLSQGREGYGKMESQKNVREFTEEQLKAGQNVIGLQMGSNKGASQAGQNFGKSRMIVD